MSNKSMKWGELDVSEEDYHALCLDLTDGSAYVRHIGDGRGQRIPPEDIYVASGEEKTP